DVAPRSHDPALRIVEVEDHLQALRIERRVRLVVPLCLDRGLREFEQFVVVRVLRSLAQASPHDVRQLPRPHAVLDKPWRTESATVGDLRDHGALSGRDLGCRQEPAHEVLNRLCFFHLGLLPRSLVTVVHMLLPYTTRRTPSTPASSTVTRSGRDDGA